MFTRFLPRPCSTPVRYPMVRPSTIKDWRKKTIVVAQKVMKDTSGETDPRSYNNKGCANRRSLYYLGWEDWEFWEN